METICRLCGNTCDGETAFKFTETVGSDNITLQIEVSVPLCQACLFGLVANLCDEREGRCLQNVGEKEQ